MITAHALQDAPRAFVGRERGKLATIRPFPYSWGIVGALGEIEREKAPKGAPPGPCVQPLCSARSQWPPMGRPSRTGRRAGQAKPDTVSDLRAGCREQGRRRPAVYRFLGGGRDLEG